MLLSTTTILFFILTLYTLITINNILNTLVVLELLAFISLYLLSYHNQTFFSSTLLLILFSLFILEATLSLILLINYLTFSGTDYVSTLTFTL